MNRFSLSGSYLYYHASREFRDLGLRGGEEGSPDDLPFAMLEKRWLARRFAAEEVKQGDIFTPSLTQSHFHRLDITTALESSRTCGFAKRGMDKRTIGHAGSLSIHGPSR